MTALTFEPGILVRDIVSAFDLPSGLVSGWRYQMRGGAMAPPEGLRLRFDGRHPDPILEACDDFEEPLMFAQVAVSDEAEEALDGELAQMGQGSDVCLEVGGVRLRLGEGVSPVRVGAYACALRQALA